MLPKIVYNKVLGSLKHIAKQVEEDRRDNPKALPLEIDNQLRSAIERHIREGHLHYNRNQTAEAVEDTFEYLIAKGLIAKSPYGGHMMPRPADAPPLPSAEEVERLVVAKMQNYGFFGH